MTAPVWIASLNQYMKSITSVGAVEEAFVTPKQTQLWQSLRLVLDLVEATLGQVDQWKKTNFTEQQDILSNCLFKFQS